MSNTNTTKINFSKFFSRENLPLLVLIAFAVFSVIAIVVSHVAFSVPIVSCCLYVILEALLVACLNRIPIWIHGLVFIGQIVAGIIASHVGFMILMAFVYVFALAFLFVWAHHE